MADILDIAENLGLPILWNHDHVPKGTQAMTEGYQVETGDVRISDALIKIAEENGWTGFPTTGTWRSWLLISDKSPNGGYYDKSCGYNTVTVADFIKLLRTPKEPLITIGGIHVKFKKDQSGIDVGCVFVPTETVDTIHAQLHASQ